MPIGGKTRQDVPIQTLIYSLVQKLDALPPSLSTCSPKKLGPDRTVEPLEDGRVDGRTDRRTDEQTDSQSDSQPAVMQSLTS